MLDNGLPPLPKFVGILNLSKDSFSDGGIFSSDLNALKHAVDLRHQGADIIDIGAESSHPDSKKISWKEEIRQLVPMVLSLQKLNTSMSIDTYKWQVMAEMLSYGVDYINDITAFNDEKAIQTVLDSNCKLVLMFSRHKSAHAQKKVLGHDSVMQEIIDFFHTKINQLTEIGIDKSRIIIDPGMGFFLGGTKEPSLLVLKNLDVLHKFGIPVYISTSKKSFIGSTLNLQVDQRESGTLATELWAWLKGVSYIRTHNVKQLQEAIKMWKSIDDSGLRII
jgi:dihydropteroate synthase type 2